MLRVCACAQASVRKTISVVPQDAVLFNQSVAYNIRYGAPGVCGCGQACILAGVLVCLRACMIVGGCEVGRRTQCGCGCVCADVVM